MFKNNLTLPQAAVALVKFGCFIFPCHPKSKKPMTKNGYKDATNNIETVLRWWQEHPNANIGLVPGKSGWLVIDVDGPVGRKSFRRLGLNTIKTICVTTGRGGHFYYRHPGGTIGNAHDLGPGLDIRADAGYVLVPPSIHPNGTTYEWGGLDDE